MLNVNCTKMKFALLLLGLLISAKANAAAWTLEKGHGQIINNFTYYQSDNYVDSSGKSTPQKSYSKYEYNPYIEYGLTDSITLGLSPSLQYVAQEIGGTDEDNANLADTEFFVRKRLFYDGQNVIAIQPLIKLPGAYDAGDLPQLGQSQIDYELRLLTGRNFGIKGRHYLNTEIAYRVRTETPGDEIRLASTLGYRVNERWQILGEANGTFAVDGAGGGNALLSNSFDYDLVKLQLTTLYWWNPKWALQFGGYHSVYTRNTGEGGGALFGVWYRF